jgi:GNAT superfamily N-acetyltransferase
VMDAANYLTIEGLRDGSRLQIRSLRADDRDDLIAAVKRTSDTSIYRRFFGIRRNFTEKEISFFLKPDFVNHVALVAVGEEAGLQVIVGGGRYILLEPGRAELAFVVIDQYQGKGIAAALLKHLARIGRAVGLKELVAEVLPENTPMLKVFQNSGFALSTKREAGVVHLTLRLT